MAVLQTIRTKAAGLLIGTLGLALLAFILSDFFSSGNAFFNKFKDKAFTVDGTTVTTGEYQKRVEEWITYTKYRTGQNSLDGDADVQLREEVYQQMVLEMMLDSQAKKLGLSVTQQELNEMFTGVNIYQAITNVQEFPWFANRQTGQFDRAMLDQFIADVNAPAPADEEGRADQLIKQQIWHVVENTIKYRRLTEKYAFLLANGVLVSETEAKASYEGQKNTANIAYVLQPYTAIADSTIKVDDKEIKALYDKRKNNFKLNSEVCKISYFIKDVVPSEEDYAAVENEMKAAHEKLVSTSDPAAIVAQYSAEPYADVFFPVSGLPLDAKSFVESSAIGDVYGPVRDNQSFIMYKLVDKTIAVDSLTVQMIPVPEPYSETSATASVADSLINVIKGGKDFAVLAREINPNPQAGLAQKVSELDLIRFGIDGEKSIKAANGEVLKLSYAGGQYTMLLKVVSKDAPVSKAKLAVIQMPVAVSDKTQSLIDNELGQFIAQSGNLQDFDKAAMEKGYGLMSNTLIYPSQPNISNAAGTRQVIHWAFNEEKGAVKKFDMSDKRVIAIVKEVIDAEYSPISQVSDILKAEIIRDKKAEKMIADLKAKNLASLDAYAQTLATKVDTAKFVNFQTINISGLGNEPIFNVYSKVGQINKLDAPLKGLRGVFALSVIDKTEDSRPYDSAQTKSMIFQSMYYQNAQQSLGALQLKAEVKDNRVRFF